MDRPEAGLKGRVQTILSSNRKIMLSATILLRSVAERGECGSGAEKVKYESEATLESYP